MSGFCPSCGLQLDDALRCPDAARHDQLSRTGRLAKVVLPAANRRRRLLGAGVEFITYCAGMIFIAIFSSFTLGVLDAFVAIPLLILISIRDAHSGLLSVEKRFARLRVVKAGSGHPITNVDAFKRNSYYLALVTLTVFPLLPLDYLAVTLFKIVLALDLLMILFRTDGRRIGDLLAGTQVVPEASEAAA